MAAENPSEEIPVTEQENPRTRELSGLPTAEVLRLMNEEDAGVALAVGRVLADVERAVDAIVERLRKGGRLFYVGTGTSGRLGGLDAPEGWDGAEVGLEHDLDGDDDPPRLRHRQPHDEPPAAQREASRSLTSHTPCGSRTRRARGARGA